MGMRIDIEGGRIVVRRPGPEPMSAFEDEGDAADLVAEVSCEEGASVDFGPSCDEPGRHGKPGFRKAAFVSLVDDRIYEIRSAHSPRM